MSGGKRSIAAELENFNSGIGVRSLSLTPATEPAQEEFHDWLRKSFTQNWEYPLLNVSRRLPSETEQRFSNPNSYQLPAKTFRLLILCFSISSAS
jgi:hypothetical protein